MFIEFAGIDCSGKTTQAKLLYEYLVNNKECILTKEPGGCDISNKIRDILVKGDPNSMDSVTELLLINAARREHIKQVIKKNLDLNKIIICDRFINSTLAYQQSVGDHVILGFHKELCFNLIPDLVILLDIDPMIAYSRGINKEESRFEDKGLLHMISVRDKFVELSKKNNNFIVFSGEIEKSELHRLIVEKINL
jgi:dTMP kinase